MPSGPLCAPPPVADVPFGIAHVMSPPKEPLCHL